MTDGTPAPPATDSDLAEPVASGVRAYDAWAVEPLPDGLSPDTIAVAAGRPPRLPDAPLSTPLVAASTFVAGGPAGYARDAHPTAHALEECLGALEGGHAVAFASGMAAISAVLDLLPTGAVVVAPTHSYAGTAGRLAELAAAGRIDLREVVVSDTDAVVAASDGAQLVWLETPTNPVLEVADIAAVATRRDPRSRLVVDSTFATPLLQQPLALGADLVVHSVTKFLAGHSDLLLGAVVARDESVRADLVRRRVLMGGAPGALESYLALRGIRTLPVRLRQSLASAAVIADRLTSHPAVSLVRYPGLSRDPGHAVASRQMRGFGAILSVELHGGTAAAESLCRNVRLWTYATSLGGVESLLERRRRWAAERPDVDESLVRLSVGLEDVEDLWADLTQALRA